MRVTRRMRWSTISTRTPSSSAGSTMPVTISTPPVGSMSVGEHVDVDGLLQSEEGRVRHGDRRRVAVGRRGHVDADGPGGGPGAVGHGVLEVVRAHRRAREPEAAGVEVGRELHVGLRRHRAQADEPGPAAHVPQRIDPDLLARGREGDEGLGDERHVARRAHRDREHAAGRVAAVGDHERDAPRRALAAVLVEHDGALRGRRQLVGALHRGGAPGRTGPRRGRPSRRAPPS